MKLELLYPLDGEIRINQRFGENANPFYQQLGLKGHNGLDLFANDGDVVYAAHDGIVTFTGEDGSGGLGVVIRSKEPSEINGKTSFFKTIYWHIQKGTFMVSPSEEVKKGQPIARADNTGMSTGTHLHWGLKPIYQGEQDWQWGNSEQDNGYNGAIDPEPYIIPRVEHQFLYNMTFGEENEEVRFLQLRLQKLGFFPAVKCTGFYGTITAQAVLAFQLAKKVAHAATLKKNKGNYAWEATRKALNAR